MIKKLGGRVPIKIAVAKAKGPKSKVYPPLGPYLKYAHIPIDQLEKQWKDKMEKWSRWRAYSCPTNDLLNELKLEQGDSSEEGSGEEDNVFKDILDEKLMAQSGYHLTYLGSLQVVPSYSSKRILE